MTVDFHTHVFPDKVAPGAVSSLEERAGLKADTDGTLAGLLSSMRRCKTDISVVMPVATRPEQTRSINDFAAGINRKNGIISFGGIHPGYEDIKGELARIQALGLRGIKLHPDYQNTFIDSPSMVGILKECGRLGLMVLTHSGVDLGLPSPVHCTPERIAGILSEIGETVLIAAHYGGNGMAEQTLKHLAGTGVYIDTSFSHQTCDRNQLKTLLEAYDEDHILFASDSPWGNPAETESFIRGLGLKQDRTDKIMYKNALKLLNV